MTTKTYLVYLEQPLVISAYPGHVGFGGGSDNPFCGDDCEAAQEELSH
jgi:hypothetical protein